MPFIIEEGVLKEYRNITGESEVVVPEGVREIAAVAFWGSIHLTSVTLPEGLRRIGDNAFEDCGRLETITIPDSVTEIGVSAFSGCCSLKHIRLSESLTAIRKWTFSRCSALTAVTFPDSVTEIGESAFYQCEALKEVKLPAGLQTLHPTAFQYCFQFEEIPLTVIDGILIHHDRQINWQAAEETAQKMRDRNYESLCYEFLLLAYRDGYDREALRQYLREHYIAMMAEFVLMEETGYVKRALSLDIDPAAADVEAMLRLALENGKSEIADLLQAYEDANPEQF